MKGSTVLYNRKLVITIIDLCKCRVYRGSNSKKSKKWYGQIYGICQMWQNCNYFELIIDVISKFTMTSGHSICASALFKTTLFSPGHAHCR